MRRTLVWITNKAFGTKPVAYKDSTFRSSDHGDGRRFRRHILAAYAHTASSMYEDIYADTDEGVNLADIWVEILARHGMEALPTRS